MSPQRPFYRATKTQVMQDHGFYRKQMYLRPCLRATDVFIRPCLSVPQFIVNDDSNVCGCKYDHVHDRQEGLERITPTQNPYRRAGITMSMLLLDYGSHAIGSRHLTTMSGLASRRHAYPGDSRSDAHWIASRATRAFNIKYFARQIRWPFILTRNYVIMRMQACSDGGLQTEQYSAHSYTA